MSSHAVLQPHMCSQWSMKYCLYSPPADSPLRTLATLALAFVASYQASRPLASSRYHHAPTSSDAAW